MYTMIKTYVTAFVFVFVVFFWQTFAKLHLLKFFHSKRPSLQVVQSFMNKKKITFPLMAKYQKTELPNLIYFKYF